MPGRTVNPRYVPLVVTTPANTASTSPQSTQPGLGHVNLDSVDLLIPPGHYGLTGIAIQLAGQHIVPFGASSSFILGDALQRDFELGLEVDNGLVVVTYNADLGFAHSHYLRFKVRDIDLPSAAPGVTGPSVIPIAARGTQ